jgi:hypothetical protein
MRRSYLPVSLMILMIAGCAGPVRTDISSAGTGVAQGSALMWAPVSEEQPLRADEQAARAAVTRALEQKGYHLLPDAPLLIDVGVATRMADIALTDGAGKRLSGDKGKHLLQNCKDRLLRLNVHIVERMSGATAYAGSAQEAHCHAALDDVLGRLGASAVADIAVPAGSRSVLNIAKD